MFNFIFDGRIGDILAPVVPSNKLHLAIQHSRNDEVRQLIVNTDLMRNTDSGYGAIHVACRYNNQMALDLILSIGVHVETCDQKGDTPLHYASKYGHIELCKYLVGLGSSTNCKNNNHQTPYDVTDNHSIRQYLLPLQLAAERIKADPITMSALGYTTYQAVTHNPPLQNIETILPPPNTTSGQYVGAMGGSYSAHPAQPLVTAATVSIAPPAVTSIQKPSGAASMRVIKPDGFHSSASDRALQEKYGHVYETKAIAPPPTFIASTAAPATGYANYSMYSGSTAAQGMGASHLNNRYVAYDVQTNSAMYPPPSSVPSVPPPYAFPQLQSPFISTITPKGPPAEAAPLVDDVAGRAVHAVATASPGAPNSRKLLGNKQIKPVAEMSGFDLHAVVNQSSPHTYSAASVQRRSIPNSSPSSLLPPVLVSSGGPDSSRGTPDCDHEVITASSSSSAVL